MVYTVGQKARQRKQNKTLKSQKHFGYKQKKKKLHYSLAFDKKENMPVATVLCVCLPHCLRVRLHDVYTRAYLQIKQHTHTHTHKA